MKNLLVPFDGSSAALRALRQALALVRLGGGSLHVVHVHEEPASYGRLALQVSPESMEALQRKHGESILARAREELQDERADHTVEVLVGPIAQTIASHAERAGCDGIVMGRHGRSALSDLLVGSVAMRVVHLSHLPVLLVP